MKNLIIILIAFLSNVVYAKSTLEEVNRLGVSHTPMGALKKGNSSGTIPDWKPVKIDSSDANRNRYSQESPLFTITQRNYKQYEKNLSPGQIKLFETYPSFKMPIYKSHRNFVLPQETLDNTKIYSPYTELTWKGNGISGTYNAVPFPFPKSGLEVLWNHLTRYRGVFREQMVTNVITYENGSYQDSLAKYSILFNFNRSDQTESDLKNQLLFYKVKNMDSGQTSGKSTLVHEPMDQIIGKRNVWNYDPGRRRVKRLPSMKYDEPILASDGLRTADDTDMFSGTPDLYDWKILGKKEVYIPYNNETLTGSEENIDDIIQAGHLNPSYTRYELHRVWVVEGKLRRGMNHIYSKRQFYVDEDSWSIAISDQYDEDGNLWRVNMAYLYNHYSAKAITSAADVFHDLKEKRYLAHNLLAGSGAEPKYHTEAPSNNYFTPNALRQRGGK